MTTKADFNRYSKDEVVEILLSALHRLSSSETEISLLKGKVEALIRQIYGRKSETIDDKQMELLLQGLFSLGKPEDQSKDSPDLGATTKPDSPERKQPRAPRLPENLPVEETILEPEEIRDNPEEWRCIGQEVSEQLDYQPGKFFKRRLIRKKYVLKNDPYQSPVIADLPAKLLDKSLPAAGLLAQIIVSKYVDHLPLYRQEQIFKQRYGVNIPRQTMVRWVELVADWVKPIYEHMRQELLDKGYLQVDETPIKYLDRKRIGSGQGYFWTYSDPGGDVLFDWHPSRAASCLETTLGKNFEGVLQCDGYAAYPAFSKKSDKIRLAGCWAHARRTFFEAKEEAAKTAGWFLNQIGILYGVERILRQKHAGPALRAAMRSSQSKPVVKRIFTALKKKMNLFLPQSRMGKAISYTLNLQTQLELYLDDGRVEIDNNLVENAIRPTAIGKKNWLFIGEVQAGQRSAILYSLLESCRRHGINPMDYLRDVLTRLPSMTNKQVHLLAPANWANPNRHLRSA